MRKYLIIALLLGVPGVSGLAQVDTTGIYGDRADSLDAAVFTSRNDANYLSKGKELRTEVISSAGLMKMACCTLAESFENSASVTVGYADATTGARQIRLLGLSGIYTQMLDENRPTMRGITAPYGLSYMPGPWLESIQVGKGSPSIVNGTESITGSINLEHHKPTDGKPLFVNASVMNDTKTDLNVVSSLQVTDNLYTVLLGHVDGNFRTFDMNGDGFADEPSLLQVNASNRWLWYSPEVQVRWGVRYVNDRRRGGQMDGPWKSDIANNLANAYLKVGRSLRDDGSSSIAVVVDYTLQNTASSFGDNRYDARQHSLFANLLYRNQFSESHDLMAGVNATIDILDEDIAGGGQNLSGVKHKLLQAAPYAEYTFRSGETLSMIAGLSGTLIADYGFYPVPRITVKYQPVEPLVLRLNGGRGLRFSHPVADNIGILSTGKRLVGDLSLRLLEDYVADGVRIPANTHLSAICKIGERLELSVRSLELGGRIVPLALDAYDTDGLPGIYCPETASSKASRKASDDAISTAGQTFGGLVGDIASTVLRTGASIAKSASGEVSVSVVRGYEFYLVKSEKR